MKNPDFPITHIAGKLISVLTICLIATTLIGCRRTTAGTLPDAGIDTKESPSPINIPATKLLTVKIPDYLDSQMKDYEGFTVSFNEYNHTPNYVAWELTASETDGPHARKGSKFRWDSDIDGCPDHDDYTWSGFDRGHMIPAADCKYSAQAMKDCFYMTNICPQNHSLNTGGWKKLEEACRDWALRYNAIIIIAGPIYKNTDSQFIGEAEVRVPSGFFKVILDAHSTQPKAIGFVYPNTSAPGEIYSYSMSVRSVEKLTRFDFFHQLPDSIEEAIETEYNLDQWKH